MKLLVTGGAGYIGSHVVLEAERAGHECVVVDNLSTGLESRIDCRLEKIDMASSDAAEKLSGLLASEKFDSVIHLAARKQVGESVEMPERYYLDNIGGLANLLLAMRETGHQSLVFSSSAATYGMPDTDQVMEDGPTKPINPYGETKLIGEWMVRNAARWGLRGVNLRYFNVAGTGQPGLADTAALNLIPIAIGQLRSGKPPSSLALITRLPMAAAFAITCTLATWQGPTSWRWTIWSEQSASLTPSTLAPGAVHR